MPFNGTPVVEQLDDRTCLISGVSLFQNDTGILGLFGASGAPTPDVVLPATFVAAPYDYLGQTIALASGVQVEVVYVSDGPFTNLPVSILYAGTTTADFRITIKNTNTGSETQDMYIRVRFMGGGRVAQPSRIA